MGRGSTVPADIKAVYLRPLENRTQRSQVEQALTRAIAEELVTRQRFAVVGSEAEANAEILGAVTGFGVTPVTFDEGGRATEYEIAVTAQITFKRVGETGEVIWKSDRYTFRENYPVETSRPSTSTARTRRSRSPRSASPRRWSPTCWKGSRGRPGAARANGRPLLR